MHESQAEVTNDRGTVLEVWLEPWGHPISLQLGQTLNIVATSPVPGSLEVVWEESNAAIYGWSKCRVSLFLDGVEFDELFELPDLGEGLSSRQFVEMIFGGPGGPK